MRGVLRYFRLYLALARYGLARELAFRGNFLIKMFVEVLWFAILLAFYQTIFAKTSNVASWSESEYLFFLGCYTALAGIIEAFFLANCSEFADLVRTGGLDFYLLQPIDEQFLVTCRDIDWSSVTNVLMGTVVMGLTYYQMGLGLSVGRFAVFLLLFASGIAIAYSLLLVLTATSVWLKRNQSLYELWWLFTSLMRYPREIYVGPLAYPLGWFFTFVVPILLVVNLPAHTMVKFMVDPLWIAFTLAAAVVLLAASRTFFRHALRRYRSASS
jgi:ABC-2 type transport system permease protein